VGELILKCDTKFKKLTWHALIGVCKTEVLHQLLIEFILFLKSLAFSYGYLVSKVYFPIPKSCQCVSLVVF
jgi:hypothetical protein